MFRTGAKRKLADRETTDRPIKPPSQGGFTFSRKASGELSGSEGERSSESTSAADSKPPTYQEDSFIKLFEEDGSFRLPEKTVNADLPEHMPNDPHFDDSRAAEIDLAGSGLAKPPKTPRNNSNIFGSLTTASKTPTLLRLLCSSRFIAALWGSLVLASTFAGFQTVLPLMVNDTFGWSSVGGGLLFLPLTAPAFLGPVVGKLTDRFGGRWFATSGFVLM